MLIQWDALSYRTERTVAIHVCLLFVADRLFGRVFWDPSQNLGTAYKLQLDKVFICTGKDGYVPAYDPKGKIYGEGKQFGCLEPNSKLKHRFLILVSNS